MQRFVIKIKLLLQEIDGEFIDICKRELNKLKNSAKMFN